MKTGIETIDTKAKDQSEILWKHNNFKDLTGVGSLLIKN